MCTLDKMYDFLVIPFPKRKKLPKKDRDPVFLPRKDRDPVISLIVISTPIVFIFTYFNLYTHSLYAI